MPRGASKMSSWLNVSSFDEKDEYYTPAVLVSPIVAHVKAGSTVWCPFDTERSEFVIQLRAAGHNVLCSHIWYGLDFFDYVPETAYDCIVSNPPFSRKLEVLSRLYALEKPFAVLLGLPILNYQEIGSFFLDKPLQLLIVDKKVSFDGNTASFNSSYFCRGMLPSDLMFAHLPHNNSGVHFVGSRMGLDLEAVALMRLGAL
jgi:hypothetical protein